MAIRPQRFLLSASVLALGLGVMVDQSGRAIDHRNKPNPRLFIAGPLARGRFGELMGVTDLAAYSRKIASEIAGLACVGQEQFASA